MYGPRASRALTPASEGEGVSSGGRAAAPALDMASVLAVLRAMAALRPLDLRVRACAHRCKGMLGWCIGLT